MQIAWRRCAALTLLAFTALAYDFAGLKPEGYLSDFAHVVDAGSRAEIEAYCARVEKATGAQMAMVTIETLYGEPIDDVANTLYRKWGIGQKGKNEGVLFLLVVNDRRSRLEVGYGLEPYITDGYAGDVLRAMRPLLRESRYGPAMLEAAQTIGGRIAEAKGVQAPLSSARPARTRSRNNSRSLWPVLFPVGIGFLIALLASRRRRGSGGGGFYPPFWYGGGGSSSGGGFGGYDSSDSFGGFGGGDSGGGGASSDW